jgi:putative hemolysin
MKRFAIIILMIVLGSFFLFGCKGVVNSKCADLQPEQRNTCCAENNVNTNHDACDGEWVWNTVKNSCYWNCNAIGKIANPASEYCVAQGNKHDIIKDAAGNEYGICKFSDGSECEEWSYFNGKCKQGDTNIAVPISKGQCESLGGKWGLGGLANFERCNLPTKDGTKSCTDGSQCEAGLCIAKAEGASFGECPAWKMNFGCINIIENGKFIGICID